MIEGVLALLRIFSGPHRTSNGSRKNGILLDKLERMSISIEQIATASVESGRDQREEVRLLNEINVNLARMSTQNEEVLARLRQERR